MRLPKFFRRKGFSDEAHRMYVCIVEQARKPVFFQAGGVPDTIDGRFELILLHVIIVLDRLQAGGGHTNAAGQELFDVMFADFDQSLREMGVGDMGIGKRIKKMGQAFYGRCEAYSEALRNPQIDIGKAIARNLYGTTSAKPDQITSMVGYINDQRSQLGQQSLEQLVQGNIKFSQPEFS